MTKQRVDGTPSLVYHCSVWVDNKQYPSGAEVLILPVALSSVATKSEDKTPVPAKDCTLCFLLVMPVDDKKLLADLTEETDLPEFRRIGYGECESHSWPVLLGMDGPDDLEVVLKDARQYEFNLV